MDSHAFVTRSEYRSRRHPAPGPLCANAGFPHAEPSPLEAGHDALAGGADSLTIHVRGDRRHMQEDDAFRIRAEVPLPLNFEMGVTGEMLAMALKLKPDFACLVPESRMEITTEGGLDVTAGFDHIRTAVARLQDAGIKVSLFVDPDPRQIEAAAESRAEMIELHTGAFANATGDDRETELARLIAAARRATRPASRSMPATASIILTSPGCGRSPTSRNSTSATRSSRAPSGSA